MRTANWLLLTAAFLVAAPASAQDWSWKGRVSTNQWLEVKGVNGNVRAVAASGDQIEVTAEKSARDDDPDEVKIEVIEHNGGVTICAVYPTPRRAREDNECAPGNRGRMNVQNNDVKVNFTVRVPRGTKFSGNTVNGGVTITGMTADVKGHTVNGSVRIDTEGVAEAHTVNGSINVAMGRANWSDVLEFETVNGAIVIELPAEVDMVVSASTVNGSIDTDYPLTVRGRWGPKRMSGTVGKGGRELSLGTVNGDIEIRKR